MNTTTASFPTLPQIGRRESYYENLIRQAESDRDVHGRAIAKVAQYVTRASHAERSWEERLADYQHCLKRHCATPPFPDHETWAFYGCLADLVRQHAGQAALRLASSEDDVYAARLAMGQSREEIARDAQPFFDVLIPRGGCPTWFAEPDYNLLTLIRNQWVSTTTRESRSSTRR
jgi:hypothetical protein